MSVPPSDVDKYETQLKEELRKLDIEYKEKARPIIDKLVELENIKPLKQLIYNPNESFKVNTNPKEAFDWLERNSTLHKNVEILYVVDGYEVSICNEHGTTIASSSAETILEAINMMIRHGR